MRTVDFEGRLTGRVERISPQVRQREVLSTNPTGDADARVVEVQVSLDRDSARRVASLAGLESDRALQNPHERWVLELAEAFPWPR